MILTLVDTKKMEEKENYLNDLEELAIKKKDIGKKTHKLKKLMEDLLV